MSTFRVLAALTIATGCAARAALAQTGGLETASLTQPAPQAAPMDAATETCPYRFDSDMPADTFCVYQGVARDGSGEECATDVMVIWSSASQTPVGASASNREVYLGFVTALDLVVRAVVDPRQSDRAEILEYTLGSETAPRPLTGRMTLPVMRPGAAAVLNMDFHEPRHFHSGDCAFASYSGTFLGMLRPAGDKFGGPR